MIGIGINIVVDILKINLFLTSSDRLSQKVTSLQNEVKEIRIDRFILLKQILERIEYYVFLVQNRTD